MITRLRGRRRARCCCTACAASARPPSRRRRRQALLRPLALLGLLVALLAAASVVVPQGRETRGAIVDWAGIDLGRAAAAAATPVPTEWPAATPVAWRQSTARGSANAGRLDGGVQLPGRGQGFYTYDPRFPDRRPNAGVRRWGTSALVRELVALGAWWARTHPARPRLGFGDLSGRGGGPLDLHHSHENGLDVDIRLPRKDGREGRAHPGNYDRERTQEIIDRLVASGAEMILIGPNLDLTGPSGVVIRWPAHDDHLHVRLPDPDGRGN